MDWIIAIATVVIATATVLYVRLTSRLARSAEKSASDSRDSASAAQDAARASERAGEAAERHLLLSVMPLVFGHRLERDAPSLGGHYRLRVFNDGPATAFNLTVLGDYPAPETDAKRAQFSIGPFASLRSGDDDWLTTPVQLVADGPYSITVEYLDPLGNAYRTTRTSLLGGQSLIRVEQHDDATDDWVVLVESGIGG